MAGQGVGAAAAEALGGILASFPVFADWTACVDYYNRIIGNGSTVNTHLTTRFKSVPLPGRYLTKLLQATGDQEKAGILNEYISKVLVDAAPMIVGLWFLNRNVLNAALGEISGSEYDNIKKLFLGSRSVRKTGKSDLDEYARTSRLFREALLPWLPNIVFGGVHERITRRVDVASGHLRGLREMFENIAMKRQDALANLDACTKMDIVFNFFMQSSALGFFTDDYEEKMIHLNRFLYFLGRKILGKDKIIERMRKAGGLISAMTEYFNETSSKHMPPYALTPSRMYDWVAVFGVLRLGDMEVFSMTPGISTRFFTHMKLTSSVAVAALLAYNMLEREIVENNDILQSERMLHQMLLIETNSYQSPLDVEGNIFDIDFNVK